MEKIAVLYLCRKGNPERFSRRFLESLIRYKAGMEYELVYVLKGYNEEETDTSFSSMRKELKCKSYEMRVSDDFFSVSAHLYAAELVASEYVLPIISYSEVQASSWLASYAHAFDSVENCAIAGATGSFERLSEEGAFPNIHIRTTAFFMERKLLLEVNRGELKTKYDNNLYEAGSNGLTQQMLNHGRKVVIVGSNYKIYHPEEWALSRTFRSGEQENLLISDNRTYDYATASWKRRRKLAQLAWGNDSMALKPKLFRRAQAIYNWKWA